MKGTTALMGIVACLSAMHLAHGDGRNMPPRASVVLTQKNIASIDPQKAKMVRTFDQLVTQGAIKRKPDVDKIRQAFDYDGGQFQVTIPKALFPIAAPHCKKNVLLRVPATDTTAPDSSNALQVRWQLFETVHAIKEGKLPSVELPIEVKDSPNFAPYMEFDRDGNPLLRWCNAYVDVKALPPIHKSVGSNVGQTTLVSFTDGQFVAGTRDKSGIDYVTR